MMPFAQNGNQFAASDGVANNDVGQAGNADPGHRQLQYGLGIVGDDIAVDMDNTDSIVGIERPAAQDRRCSSSRASTPTGA